MLKKGVCMKISQINDSSPDFGAKIAFTNPHHYKTMPNINDFSYAKRILDSFEKKCPDAAVKITYRKAYNLDGSYLEAKNSKTGGIVTERLKQKDFEKDFNDKYKSFGGCDTFYALLETLLNKSNLIYKDFWGEEKFVGGGKMPDQHDIFV